MTETRVRWMCTCKWQGMHPVGEMCTSATPVAYEDDGCEPGNHRRDALCARTRVSTAPTANLLRYHYGPTAADPDPGAAWCYDCGGRVDFFDGHAVCGCGAQVCESPVDCGDDTCEYRTPNDRRKDAT